MATKKAAKKAAKGAKKSAKAASKKASKKADSAKPPAKKVMAKGKPDAKKRPPPKKKSDTRRPRSTALIVTVEPSGLTFQDPPGTPVAYEMVLFVDKAHWTAEQQAKVEKFVADLGLNPIAVAKGWGGP